METIKTCPECKCDVKWENMVWLDGICTCPKCYIKKRLDTEEDKTKEGES